MWSNARLGPAFLIYFHIVVYCLSLIYVAEFYADLKVVMFDQSRFYAAALNIAPLALASILFAFSRFSFGYILGFYFYTMILGYLWLVAFSRFNYDHAMADISIFGSALAFPRSCAVYHLAAQAKVCHIYPGRWRSCCFPS